MCGYQKNCQIEAGISPKTSVMVYNEYQRNVTIAKEAFNVGSNRLLILRLRPWISNSCYLESLLAIKHQYLNPKSFWIGNGKTIVCIKLWLHSVNQTSTISKTKMQNNCLT